MTWASHRVARTAATLGFIALALGPAGCSGGGTSGQPPSGGSTTSTPSATSSPVPAPPGTVPGTLPGTTVFTDPQGTYTIEVPSGWKAFASAANKESEFWAVAEPANGFTANVSVTSQTIRPGSTLQQFVDSTSAAVASQLGSGKVTSTSITQGASAQLGVVEYGGVTSGTELRSLAVVGLSGHRTAVVATLTALPLDYPGLRRQNEQYLLTLNPAPPAAPGT